MAMAPHDFALRLEPSLATTGDAALCLVKESLEHLQHRLPAQAPLRDFVHHNTLHAFQHLPFADALSAAARLTGARPWLAEERCHEFYHQGRVTAADLDAALRQLPECRAGDRLYASGPYELTRGEVLRAMLVHPSANTSLARLRWQVDEAGAGERLAADLDPVVRDRFLRLAAAEGHDETSAVADLLLAARELHPALPGKPGVTGADAAAPASVQQPPSAAAAGALWRDLCGRLGERWTLLALLVHLTGEDLREPLQATLIRHLGSHLDQGLAAWRNPESGQGFYAAWRNSAACDWGWELDELAGARRDIEQLPADALSVIVSELRRLALDVAQWPAFLQRLAFELPGWGGMCHWRETHPSAGGPPVSLADFIAVRLVVERLYAEALVRRLWGIPLNLVALGEYFVARPAELWVRNACGSGQVPERLRDRIWPLLAQPAADAALWGQLADQLAATPRHDFSTSDRQTWAAWPLFMTAQRLGLTGRCLRTIGASGGEALLACAASLTTDQRGLIWLLAYEHHYREQILAALAANHGRASAFNGAVPRAQFVLCMDDREEGTRRHLEEVNPAFETFGAAGFFGVPISWQGLDDERPSALCPIVVRPANAVREVVAPAAEGRWLAHRRRRQVRLGWREKLHQGSRRGWLQATLMTTVAAPLGLLGLLARTLAPGRVGAWFERSRQAFDLALPGVVPVTADDAEASRAASPDAPRLGFSEDEQTARVAGFLRTIGLTDHFAPLVIVAGHGSDSRNNPHLAAYDCGACSGRHGGPNARVFAAMANRPSVRARLAEQGLRIPQSTHFVGAEHNTCDETFVWFDVDQIPATHEESFAALRRDCEEAAALHAVERCRRFASAPRDPAPRQAQRHLADRRQDLGQARPELGHATVAAAFVGRRTMSRGVFFDRRVFLISYDPEPDVEGRVLEATLLAAGPVGAGINLEYYFSTVDNEGFGCGSKVTHNLAGLFGVMQGASSDLRTGLPLQMVEIHEPMRLLVVVEQTLEIINAIYERQPPLQELIGNGWILLAAKHPQSGVIDVFEPACGWQRWSVNEAALPPPRPAEVDRSADWFAGSRDPLPPALLRRPLVAR